MSGGVTIGVPVYRGERFLEETLHSIQEQSYDRFNVVMSVDSHDAACEAICAKFLEDSRFAMVVQPSRLGWVRNLNWLLQHVTGSYWYFHQQDDLIHEEYLKILVSHLDNQPNAALAYCDIIPIGRINEGVFSAPSVTGTSPFGRVMTMMQEHFPAFAFRGLARSDVLRLAGPINTNDVDNFGVDITWLLGIALHGELHRIAQPLYWKRYHDKNTESRWWGLPRAEQLRYWAHHCIDMLRQSLRVRGSPEQCRLLWLAAAARLTAPEAAGHFLRVAELTATERRGLIEQFLKMAEASLSEQLQLLLDADWTDVCEMARAAHFLPRTDPVEIVAFGPDEPLKRGVVFNPQADGGAGLWLRTNRRLPPGSRINLNGHVLETVLQDTLVTASVPVTLLNQAGRLPIFLTRPDGMRLSTEIYLTVGE